MEVGIGRGSDGAELVGVVAEKITGHWLLPLPWIALHLHACVALWITQHNSVSDSG